MYNFITKSLGCNKLNGTDFCIEIITMFKTPMASGEVNITIYSIKLVEI